MRVTLESASALGGAAVAASASAAAAIAAWLSAPPFLLASVALATGLAAALAVRRVATRPARRLVGAVAEGVRSFHDGDLSFRLAPSLDPVAAEVAALFNSLGEALREGRADLVQRELLLDTLLQSAPLGILLVDERDRVVLANAAARALLRARRSPVGRPLADALGEAPAALREPLARGEPGVVLAGRAGSAGDEDAFRLLARDVFLHTRRHRLLVVERIGAELRRAEADAWKRVVAVVSHELNNSLAPVSSLVHSARVVAEKGDPSHRLPEILGGIDERVKHLARFLEGYSRLARLPRPQPRPLAWAPLLDAVRPLYPFHLEGTLPEEPVVTDPAQLQQVLVNLLKNAHEAGGTADDVVVTVAHRPDGGAEVTVLDRGTGMTDETMRSALLPFTSGKPGGTGLGLPLSAEIVAAHGGTLRLAARAGGGTAVSFTVPAGSPRGTAVRV